MVVNLLIFIGVEQLKSFLDFMFLILTQLFDLVVLLFVFLSSVETDFIMLRIYVILAGIVLQI